MLPAGWAAALKNPRSRKVILVSIIFGRDASVQARKRHPGTLPGAIRAATHDGVALTRNESSYPYWPTIVGWPEVEYSFDPRDRRAELTTVPVRLMPTSDFPLEQLGVAGTPTAYARVDLWTDGMDFDSVIPLVQGPVVDASFNRFSEYISLSIADGDIQRKVEFPPGQFRIERAEFPQAPDFVVGYAPRSTIFGPFPDVQIPCYQIDQNGQEFYVCEPALSAPAPKVYIGGEDIATKDFPAPRHVVAQMSNGQTYSKLVFDKPIADSGILGQVTVAGGVGLSTEHPAVTLLRYGGYLIDSDTEAKLKSLPLNFFVFVNNSGNVVDLVRQRILAQTDLVGTFRLDKFHTYQVGGNTPSVSLGLGSELLFRDTSGDVESPSEDIYNAIEVRFNRDMFTVSETTKTSYLLDSEHGPHSIRNLLRLSERLYGRRYLKVEAPDLVQYNDAVAEGAPSSVVNLGVKIASVVAIPSSTYTYIADWYDGMALGINWQVTLTDPTISASPIKCRVVRQSITPYGPRISLQTVTDDLIRAAR